MLGGLGHGNMIMPEEVSKLTIAAVRNSTVSFGMYDAQTPLPFTSNDEWEYLRDNPLPVLGRYWPQHDGLLRHDESMLPKETKTLRMHATTSDLGVEAERDFGWFLDELAGKDHSANR